MLHFHRAAGYLGPEIRQRSQLSDFSLDFSMIHGGNFHCPNMWFHGFIMIYHVEAHMKFIMFTWIYHVRFFFTNSKFKHVVMW
jgi:hypothetical protein